MIEGMGTMGDHKVVEKVTITFQDGSTIESDLKAPNGVIAFIITPTTVDGEDGTEVQGIAFGSIEQIRVAVATILQRNPIVAASLLFDVITSQKEGQKKEMTLEDILRGGKR